MVSNELLGSRGETYEDKIAGLDRSSEVEVLPLR